MTFIIDEKQEKRLKENNINIKTSYIVGTEHKYRNTNNINNDDINKGIISSKEYYLNDKLIHKENMFDSRIEYTFISKELENQEYTCPNCGIHMKLKDFKNGCIYCGSKYNMDYTDKDQGSKYTYDLVLKSNTYRIVSYVIDLIISIIIAYIFIIKTSRTFNSYDIGKIFVYGGILSIILYYFFYLLDAYVILGTIRAYKERINDEQRSFWKKNNIDKKKFYNNLNYEVKKYLYSNNNNIIDYDILDYNKYITKTINNRLVVYVNMDIRVIEFIGGKIISKLINKTIKLVRHEENILEIKAGVNLIRCSGCDASIDATKGKCDYCGNEVGHIQEWMLEE